MKDYVTLISAIAITLAALVSATIWVRYESIAISTKEAYAKGFKDGKASVSTPKACVAWWFEEDAKIRHQQAVQAYCKGVK